MSFNIVRHVVPVYKFLPQSNQSETGDPSSWTSYFIQFARSRLLSLLLLLNLLLGSKRIFNACLFSSLTTGPISTFPLRLYFQDFCWLDLRATNVLRLDCQYSWCTVVVILAKKIKYLLCWFSF